jgi:hypothetical protein
MNIKYYQILSFEFLLSNVYLIVCPIVIFLFSISPSGSFQTAGTLAFHSRIRQILFRFFELAMTSKAQYVHEQMRLNIGKAFEVLWTCIVIYMRNKDQQDALFFS